MQIDFFKYTLNPKVRLNRFSKDNRFGVLLRIDSQYYIDYHPWTEFGDIKIDELLEKIKHDSRLPEFLEQVLALEKERNVIKTKCFFNNHLYSTKSKVLSKVVKIKFLKDFKMLNSAIDSLTEHIIRIDFNNGSHYDEVSSWWKSLSSDTKSRIEYIEDPYKLKDGNWSELKYIGIPLACDRNNYDPICCDKIIFKPNVDIYRSLDAEMVFSSYMGHDLGIYHSFLALMKWGDLSLYHGINTPNIYEEQIDLFDSYDKQFSLNKNNLRKLYKILEEYKWTPLM